jgi:hypothetical protein
VAFRRAALEEVGGLPDDFFMQAEEYDLSLRLLNAGWSVTSFADLHVTHLKTPTARASGRTMRLDVRNNLTLVARHFPDRWVWPFAVDWMARYYRIARANGQTLAYLRGLCEGLLRAMSLDRRRPVSSRAFERFARVDQIRDRMQIVAGRTGMRRVLFVDYGKNIFAYWRAAKSMEIEIVAIADPNLAGATYRGIRVVDDETARALTFDAAIISNSSPAHAADRRARWCRLTRQPVIDLLEADAGITVAAPRAWRSRQTAAHIASRAA